VAAAFFKPTEDVMIEVNEKMLAFVKDQLPDGDWSAPVEAERLLASLPDDLLRDWLAANTRGFLTRLLTDIRQHERANAFHLRTAAKRASTFAKYKEGDQSLFDMRFVVNDEHLSRRLGDMTHDDLMYVRDRYLSTAADATAKAEFMEDLATRVGPDQTVREALQEDTVRSVLDKYFRPDDATAVA
jgi:hypothetical protein